jgi:PhnB protein
MKRTLMQIYVKDSVEAVKFYQKAFDAKLGYNVKNDDGGYIHAELDIFGQILAIAESNENATGNNMQFCLLFHENEKDIVSRIYEVLKTDARHIGYPLGECIYSPHMASLIDKYGIYWCLFTD